MIGRELAFCLIHVRRDAIVRHFATGAEPETASGFYETHVSASPCATRLLLALVTCVVSIRQRYRRLWPIDK